MSKRKAIGSVSERNRRVILRLSAICVALAVILGIFSALAVGVVSDYVEEVVNNQAHENAYPSRLGSIYDSQGRVLVESQIEKYVDEDGDDVEKPVRVFTDEYARAFGSLLGYYSSSSPVNNYGLHKLYKDWLCCGDDISKDVGGSLKLTIDAELQLLVYNYMMENYPDARMAATVVLEIDSGKVLAMADTPSYNPNEKLTSEILEDNVRAPLLMKAFESHFVMGSTIKIPTLIIAANDGYAEYYCNDPGTKDIPELNYTVCNLSKNKSNGIIGMKEAIKLSSNVYVAEVAAKIGAGRLEQQYNKLFLMDEPIYCDFGGVYRSRFNFHTEGGFLDSSYGEGDFRTNPTKMAMIVAALGSDDGSYFKPYAIGQKINADGKVVETGKKEILVKNAVSPTAKEVVIDGMEMAAKYYGIGEVCGRTVAAKSGTASITDTEANSTKNNISMVALYPSDDPKYAIAVCVGSVPDKTYGKTLAPFVKLIIEKLADMQ